jgi:predicted negative regulator of RcsB-dependent stress response
MQAKPSQAFYDQLIALEKAAQDHVKNDPDAAVDALNAAIAAD